MLLRPRICCFIENMNNKVSVIKRFDKPVLMRRQIGAYFVVTGQDKRVKTCKINIMQVLLFKYALKIS